MASLATRAPILSQNTSLLLFKFGFRCAAHMTGLLWHREEAQCRAMMRMHDSLLISDMHFAVEHPHTLWHGTESVDMVLLREDVGHCTPW